MPISSITLNNFRQFSNVTFEPCKSGFTWIVGDNACGKTTLLESIHYLGFGRSFRSSQHIPLIKQQENELLIFAELTNPQQISSKIGMRRQRNGDRQLHIDGAHVTSLAAFAPLLPLRTIHSQSHNLFELGPNLRRKFLDWGVFYHFPQFMNCWRTYEHVLKQRNQLLRLHQGYSTEITPWTVALIQAAEELNSLRNQYVSMLMPVFWALAAELLPELTVEMEYAPGWHPAKTFPDALMTSLHEECRVGYTIVGPHKADLALRIEGVPVRHFLSRGQQKLLICAMIIAQGSLCFQVVGKEMIYLVDDLTAELDLVSAKRLLNLLSQQTAQVLVSAIPNTELFKIVSQDDSAPSKMFHVKHQRIEPSNWT